MGPYGSYQFIAYGGGEIYRDVFVAVAPHGDAFTEARLFSQDVEVAKESVRLLNLRRGIVIFVASELVGRTLRVPRQLSPAYPGIPAILSLGRNTGMSMSKSISVILYPVRIATFFSWYFS